MDTTTFWALIEKAKQRSGGNSDRQIAELTDALTALEVPDLIAFDLHFDQFMALSYTRELWAAAYIINGGCSDDGFDYFRGWLIAQGEAVFQSALLDPETLVEIAERDAAEFESILSIARYVYEHKTGQEMPLDARVAWQLNDELWDEETKYAMYPKLAAKFG